VAIVVGEQDRVTPASLSLELHELMPQATLTVVPDTGHMVMVEAPDELVAQVRNVINHVQLGDA
jgi:pimeloyl-ACP methyl ester carboxylesterase